MTNLKFFASQLVMDTYIFTEELDRQLFNGLSDKSIDTYRRCVGLIRKAIGSSDIIELIRSGPQSIQALEVSSATKIGFFKVCSKYCRYNYPDMYDSYATVLKEHNDAYEKRAKKTVKGLTSLENYQLLVRAFARGVIKEMSDIGPWKNGKQRMLCLLLTFHFPARRAEYCNLRLVKNKEIDGAINMIVWNEDKPEESKIILKEYKSSKFYNRFEETLPEQLWQYIEDAFDVTKDDQYLFCTQSGKPFDQPRYSKMFRETLKEYIGLDFSINDWRRFYAQSETAKNDKDIVRKMAHSQKVHDTIYGEHEDPLFSVC